ncbi:cell envelope integrity protein CreD [Elongatibacter sediminis]|uniref:Cell envelope integrity protein CreD n=1 Tax=Elongatibacter sediminis TaxID=3119006 RepID=A0AAW9RD16_9GAMM
MNVPHLIDRNQATLKLLFVGTLSLVMLIPLVMVRGVIDERQGMQHQAQATIAQRWGGGQMIGGLVALSQSTVETRDPRGTDARQNWRAQVLPEVDLEARLTTEFRYLGIYEVPVYTTGISVSGVVDPALLRDSAADGDLVLWLPLADVRGVRDVSDLRLGDIDIPARPLDAGAAACGIFGLQFTLKASDRARLWADRDPDDTGKHIPYRLNLRLAGSHSLQFLPLADTTRVSLEADWPHPEFIGQFLPAERTITETTTARWTLLGLNRPFAGTWHLEDLGWQQLAMSAFGLRLETPVDAYQRNERSVKYGFLFISLTFFTLFLFEVMTGRPLHPVPYVLTGAALAVFYLVLLALSEYLPFAAAFALAAGLLLAIVAPYTGVVLGGRRRGVLVGLMMAVTYGLLYVLVSAEHAALLLGSLALLAAIAGLMYLTRRVDWYGYGRSGGAVRDEGRSG